MPTQIRQNLLATGRRPLRGITRVCFFILSFWMPVFSNFISIKYTFVMKRNPMDLFQGIPTTLKNRKPESRHELGVRAISGLPGLGALRADSRSWTQQGASPSLRGDGHLSCRILAPGFISGSTSYNPVPAWGQRRKAGKAHISMATASPNRTLRISHLPVTSVRSSEALGLRCKLWPWPPS